MFDNAIAAAAPFDQGDVFGRVVLLWFVLSFNLNLQTPNPTSTTSSIYWNYLSPIQPSTSVRNSELSKKSDDNYHPNRTPLPRPYAGSYRSIPRGLEIAKRFASLNRNEIILAGPAGWRPRVAPRGAEGKTTAECKFILNCAHMYVVGRCSARARTSACYVFPGLQSRVVPGLFGLVKCEFHYARITPLGLLDWNTLPRWKLLGPGGMFLGFLWNQHTFVIEIDGNILLLCKLFCMKIIFFCNQNHKK